MAIRRGVQQSVDDLERDVTAFIAATNADPKPFQWVKSADDKLIALGLSSVVSIDAEN